MITLFHGSVTIVKQPLTTVGRKNLDFGQGFYVTPIQEQAEKWGQFVASRHPAKTNPYLNIYEMDLDLVTSNYNVLNFNEYDIDWLNFVVACRKGDERWKQYDMITGGVANDKVIDTVEDYKNGIITANQAIGQLKYHKPNFQICISNQIIIDNYLIFKDSKIITKL